MGTTGPKEIDPATGKPYGLSFPVITIGDMVRAQAMLIDNLGIEQLFCVIGGSMGGMQVLQWAARYPERVFAAVPIATAARHSAQNIAFHEVGRQAIMADPDWCGGDYCEARRAARGAAWPWRAWPRTSPICPRRRCTASSAAACRTATGVTYGFDADFQVESYLRHQGIDFRRAVRRQLLSLHHPRDGLFRPGGRAWRRRWPTPSRHPDALLRHLVHQRLAVSDVGEPRDRACAERRRRECQLRRDRDRQGPRCLPAGRAGVRHDLERLPQRLGRAPRADRKRCGRRHERATQPGATVSASTCNSSPT